MSELSERRVVLYTEPEYSSDEEEYIHADSKPPQRRMSDQSTGVFRLQTCRLLFVFHLHLHRRRISFEVWLSALA